MKFSFGIITNNGPYIDDVIKSIINLNIKNYEIIVVGSICNINDNIIFIPYEEELQNFSISTKKNIIIDKAKYENIVFLHDYIFFNKDWYEGFLKFGNNFDICVTKIFNKDGHRYRDWCLWRDDADNFVSKNNYLIPYEMKHLSKMMYISGAYWIAKKEFMIKNKLNENLKWNQGEDVEWSIRTRNKTQFKINTESSVHLLKQKDRIFNETSDEENLKLFSIKDYNNNNAYNDLIKNHLFELI